MSGNQLNAPHPERSLGLGAAVKYLESRRAYASDARLIPGSAEVTHADGERDGKAQSIPIWRICGEESAFPDVSD